MLYFDPIGYGKQIRANSQIGFFTDDWTVSCVDGWTPHSQLANPRHGEFWGAHTVAVVSLCLTKHV